MAQELEEWLNTEVAKAEKYSINRLSTEYFFRDPSRPVFIDHEHFYSPADGVILYQKIIQDSTQPIVEIKGSNYTLQDVISDENFNMPCLVIGIFMTFYDVHINRIPYPGMLKFKKLDPIESENRPMLALEKDILNLAINNDNMEYLKYNERMKNTIYVPSLDYYYYLIQIADEDVNVISHFTQDQNEHFGQNDRFSFIRWGSQVDLVLPLDDRFDFEVLLKDTMHVNAGLDRLVKINFKPEAQILKNDIQSP